MLLYHCKIVLKKKFYFLCFLGLEKRIIYVDRETGVNYLYLQVGYGGGLTPLLDADGKPVVTGQAPDGGEGFEKG